MSNLTASEAAAALGVEKQTIINMIKDGRIQAEKDEKNRWMINASIFYAQHPNAASKFDSKASNLTPSDNQNLTIFDSGLVSKLQVELAAERARVANLEEQVRREREISAEYRTDKLRAEDAAKAANAIAAALTDQRAEEDKARHRQQEAQEQRRAELAARVKAQAEFDALPFWKKLGKSRPA